MGPVSISYEEIYRIFGERLKISEWSKRVAEKYGYRPYMVARYVEMLGEEETIELLESFEKRDLYRPVIRCNDLKCSCRRVVESLEKKGFGLSPIEWSGYSYRVVARPRDIDIGHTHEYLKGCFYLYRDASSLVPPLILAPSPGDLVLDSCAAPGGKTAHILLLMRDEGLVIANDLSRSRLAALRSNLDRMGFRNYVITRHDARRIHEVFEKEIPKILVDVPCSAEGAIMFDPERKTRTEYIDLARLVSREIEILASSIEALAPGGLLVYSTCSIAPEENEFVVSRVVEAFDEEIEIVGIGEKRWSTGLKSFLDIEFVPGIEKCIRIWPHRHGMEGYFVCLLRRR